MSGRRILVVAAHPDDELLGCGGTVALHTSQGDRVQTVVAAEGESLRYGPEGVGQPAQMDEARRILGVERIHHLGFADQTLDQVALTELITRLEGVVREFQPEVVYTQWGGDVNLDHQLLFKAQLVATRPTEGHVRRILAFDTASSTEWGYPRDFVPDTWVDISATLDTKLRAMECYESEVRDYPHPRSIESLRNRAKAWGNQVCLPAAEVFMTIRDIRRNGETPD